MKTRRHNRWASGFTIIELIITIIIGLILAGATIPNFLTWLPTHRLSSAARQVATDLNLARMKAVSQGVNFRLNFQSVNSYVLEKNSGGFATESGPFTLPDGITTAIGTTSEFQPRGTASADDTITLSNGSAQKLVCVKSVGRVSIEDSSCS